MKKFIIYIIGFVTLSATLPQCKEEPREFYYGDYKITVENSSNIKMTLLDVYNAGYIKSAGVNMLNKVGSAEPSTLGVKRNSPLKIRVHIMDKCMDICDSTFTVPTMAIGDPDRYLHLILNADSTLTLK